MYGADMGFLSVQVSTNDGNTWSTDLWIKSGNQNIEWKEAMLRLS